MSSPPLRRQRVEGPSDESISPPSPTALIHTFQNEVIPDLQAQLRRITTEGEAKDALITALRQDVETIRVERDAARNITLPENAQLRINELVDERDDLKQRILDLETELGRKTAEGAAKDAEAVAKDAQIAALEATTTRSDITRVQGRLGYAIAQNEIKDAEIASLKRDLEVLRAQLDATRNTPDDAQARINDLVGERERLKLQIANDMNQFNEAVEDLTLARADNARLLMLLDPVKAELATKMARKELEALEHARRPFPTIKCGGVTPLEKRHQLERLDFVLTLRDKEMNFLAGVPGSAEFLSQYFAGLQTHLWEREYGADPYFRHNITMNAYNITHHNILKARNEVRVLTKQNNEMKALEVATQRELAELKRKVVEAERLEDKLRTEGERMVVTRKEFEEYMRLKSISDYMVSVTADTTSDAAVLRVQLSQAKEELERVRSGDDNYEIDGEPKWTRWQRKYWDELVCDAHGNPVTDEIGNATLKRTLVERKLKVREPFPQTVVVSIDS